MFRVVKCPFCKYFQVTGAKKRFSCLKCSKTKEISYLKVYFKSENSRECALALQELKKEEHQEHDDFFSYK